jgi:O-antigen/teichoic acid export membrane protein
VFTFTFGYFSAFVEPFLIKAYFDTASVGIYYVAFQVSMLCGTLLAPVSMLVFPSVTGLRTRGEEPITRRILQRLVPQGVFVINAALLVAMVAAEVGVQTAFGSAYAGALGPLLILLAAVAFQSVTVFFSPVMAAYDMTREAAWLNTAGGIVAHLIPQLILIPVFGLYGAAASWVIWYICSAVVCLGLVERRLGLELRQVLLIPVFTLLGSAALLYGDGPVAGAVAVGAIVAVGVVWARAWNVFSSDDAQLLEALGMPRLATAAYSGWFK